MSEKIPSSALADIDGLPFEKALAELEQIVSRLERGDVPLEESIAIFERGELLKKHCDALLKTAEARIEKISQAGNGTVATEPLDVEA
ncbi:exodeoxyribonuclease VII small subunit [Pseudochelatococcus lubricantis]|uniref:Exodeoxyribonuclease 7 small subunit n=1 Tax=Pseudochelatococcus lubricantis TaxID=1538102 RepID=A0ABX0V4T3_9HYPH|nr:exodeoxyribonuclease VII small subunit [Pseudochelatococcus lubricantis]NIJ59593.1 exodeoxyribonuclease VII small subunit [Pseudochelatococcus lubricantis]